MSTRLIAMCQCCGYLGYCVTVEPGPRRPVVLICVDCVVVASRVFDLDLPARIPPQRETIGAQGELFARKEAM